MGEAHRKKKTENTQKCQHMAVEFMTQMGGRKRVGLAPKNAKQIKLQIELHRNLGHKQFDMSCSFRFAHVHATVRVCGCVCVCVRVYMCVIDHSDISPTGGSANT